MVIPPDTSVLISIMSYEGDGYEWAHVELRNAWNERIRDLDGVFMNNLIFDYPYQNVRIDLCLRKKK